MKKCCSIILGVLLFTSLCFGTSPLPPKIYIAKVTDYSIADGNLYLEFDNNFPCQAQPPNACPAGYQEFSIERGNTSEEKLKEIKKLVYLAFTLKKSLNFSIVPNSNVVDLSKPISISQESY